MKTNKLKNGWYSARVYLGYVNGRNVVRRISAPTIPELKKKIAEEKLKLKLDTGQSVALASVSVRDAFNSFIRKNEKIFSPSTIKGYHSVYRCFFSRYADRKVTSIMQKDLQSYISENASNLSSKTLMNRVRLFIQFMTPYVPEAKNWQFRMPPVKKYEIYIPTKDEVEQLLAYAHQEFPEYELPIMLGAFCGLRRSEIGALSYDDVDLEKKTVTVSKAVVLDSSRAFVKKMPKSYAGFRSVPLSDRMVQFIRERQKIELRLITVNPEQITDHFPAILQGSGVHHMRFHDLRHFFASYLVTLNIPDLYAIRLTGHSTTSMLQRVYQHTMSEAEKKYQDALRGAF